MFTLRQVTSAHASSVTRSHSSQLPTPGDPRGYDRGAHRPLRTGGHADASIYQEQETSRRCPA
jgi:hypothetical protein